ncbi:PAS domain S-box protein [uncultured Methanospirillum sp.]|uniref:hybrid sensor histidine kinase/response regulator n=1 Tax=uncultured Methanospirillum sp. TaxID=262503 RepID=UPI0029C8F049|nr:PAS domain S-box protein [uncultured Methanospirillum sp.]
MVSLLLIDTDPSFCSDIDKEFKKYQEYTLQIVSSRSEARQIADLHQSGIIISGCSMSESLEILREIRDFREDVPFIVLAARGEEECMVEAISAGVDLVIPKGEPGKLCQALSTAISRMIQEKYTPAKRACSGSAEEKISVGPSAGYCIEALKDAIPLPVFSRDISGVYNDCNTAFEELLGLSRSDIVGKTNHDIFPSDVAEHCGHMDELIIKHPYIQQYEYNFSLPQGGSLDVLISKNVLRDETGAVYGIIGIIYDLSDRKMFEQIVYASEEKYRTLADYTYDWEAWISPEGVYQYVSPSCERITGYQPEEFLSDPDLVIDITHLDDKEKIRCHYQGEFSPETGACHMDYRIITRSGEERWISHICQSVFRDDGTWIGRRESKRDITFRKEIEKAYQQANLKLSLLSSITRHDVLNQLSVLIGFTDMALEMNTDPEIGIMLRRVMAAAETISNQISFTRTYQDIGLQELAWQQVYDVIRNASDGISIASVETDKTLRDLEVLADPLLEKVFFCLLDNSERHGKSVSICQFSCREEDESLVIVYEDNGVGIDSHEKMRIFERGYGKNTGYGLFLAKEILAMSGVTITETGISGEGVRFEIRFLPGFFRRDAGLTR